MGHKPSSNVPGDGVNDDATLYLCRQGQRWVVVIESPRITGALRLDHFGGDSYDAQFELLRRAGRACPDAVITSTDGARKSKDYEWRLEVRGVEAQAGDLGVALHRELSAESAADCTAPLEQSDRRCHQGRRLRVSGRPRSF